MGVLIRYGTEKLLLIDKTTTSYQTKTSLALFKNKKQNCYANKFSELQLCFKGLQDFPSLLYLPCYLYHLNFNVLSGYSYVLLNLVSVPTA